MGVEGIFTDNRAGPDALHEFVLTDELAGGLNQNFDDVECAPADGDRHPSRAQLTAGDIDLPVACLIQQSILSGHFASSQKFFRFFQKLPGAATLVRPRTECQVRFRRTKQVQKRWLTEARVAARPDQPRLDFDMPDGVGGGERSDREKPPAKTNMP
jgi:hypothetical protein